ncbi:nitrogen fixation negative regulator NifL [Vibrio cincinnatiensis]|uniref:nitrogen fixation negative regulator NifL n=1 Tax=Vibrio cincinnatiensis TaxID=675 RepID=UPI001EE0FDE5|nr:nitrogen fixation negative regulator NifL [Vibrio cincinnatiensis]MCG3724283.1 nitrogen fixation negative regulator NifL [Vibrio cincinnatiensis]
MEQLDSLLPKSNTTLFDIQAFEQIVAHAPVAISITDKSGNILFINQTFSQITGYTSHELIGKNSSLLSYKATPQRVYQQMWVAITSGDHWQGQLVNRKKNGEPYIAEMSISRLKEHKGETRYYAIHRDITEQHQRITEQKNQFTLFQAVLNGSSTAIALIDAANKLLVSNKNYQRIKNSLHHSPIDLLLDSIQRDYQQSSVVEFIGEHTNRTQNISVRSEDGQCERWFEFTLVKIPVSTINIEHYFIPNSNDDYGVISITERTKEKLLVEERRINATKLMVRDNKYVHAMQEALMGTLHQLQGPFNVINSAVNILKRTKAYCPGLIAMDDAMASANTAMQEIMLAIPERERETPQPVNLNETIRDSCSISNDELMRLSINLELKLSPKLSSINGTPHRLILALKQLIDNALDAIKYARPSDRILFIQSYEKNGEIMVDIEDSGLGIKEDLRLTVFQPFYSTKPNHQSGCRGIGLSIVQQVLNEHSATMTISDSRRLHGARICLTFPINRGKSL